MVKHAWQRAEKRRAMLMNNRGEKRDHSVFIQKYLPLCVHPAAKVMPAVPEKTLPSETVLASKVAAVPALQ
jgi:hypothetical protein